MAMNATIDAMCCKPSQIISHNSSYFVCIAAIAIVNSIYLNNIFDIFRSQYHFNYFWVELSAPEDIDEMELGFIAGGELS